MLAVRLSVVLLLVFGPRQGVPAWYLASCPTRTQTEADLMFGPGLSEVLTQF